MDWLFPPQSRSIWTCTMADCQSLSWHHRWNEVRGHGHSDKKGGVESYIWRGGGGHSSTRPFPYYLKMHGMSLKNNQYLEIFYSAFSQPASLRILFFFSFLRWGGCRERFAICRMIALTVKKSGPHLLSTRLPVHPPWEEVCCAVAPLNQHCYNDVSHLTLCSSVRSHGCQDPQWAALHLAHTRDAFWFMGEPGAVTRKLPLSKCQRFHIHQLAHPRSPQPLCLKSPTPSSK